MKKGHSQFSPGSSQHSGNLNPLPDQHCEFGSFVAATSKRLKSQGFCLKSREIFFANLLRCLGPDRPKPICLYQNYLAAIAHENAARMANGPNLLTQASRSQFYRTSEGLKTLARSFQKSKQAIGVEVDAR